MRTTYRVLTRNQQYLTHGPAYVSHSLSYLMYYAVFCSKLTCDDTTSRLVSGIYHLEGMTTPDNNDTYLRQPPYLWERTRSYAPTPGYLGREYTPFVNCPSPGPEKRDNGRSSLVYQSQSDQLGVLPVIEQDNGGTRRWTICKLYPLPD